jgi:gluconate 5-dehydrogenase
MTTPNLMLEDKVAVVSGASRGIGRAIAELFARQGATVVICGRKQETLLQAASEMKDCAGRVYPLACHVGRAGDIQRLVDTTHREFGKIDILVNNAGCNVRKPALDVSWDDWNLVLDTNLRGTFFVSQAAASAPPSPPPSPRGLRTPAPCPLFCQSSIPRQPCFRLPITSWLLYIY